MNNNRLEIYDKVNETKTLDELANVILSLQDEYGLIMSRTKVFNAENNG